MCPVGNVLRLDSSNTDVIGLEGTIEYLETLGLDPEEPAVLVLSWFLQAPSVGAFTRQGFLEGWKSVGYTNTNEHVY